MAKMNKDEYKNRIRSYNWALIGAIGTQIMAAFSFMPKEYFNEKLGKNGKFVATAATVFIGISSILSFIKAWSLSKFENKNPSVDEESVSIASNKSSQEFTMGAINNKWQQKIIDGHSQAHDHLGFK